MRWGAGNVTRLRLHSYSSVNRTFLSFNSTYLHRHIRQSFHMRIYKLLDVTAYQQPNHGSNVQARYLDPEYRLVMCIRVCTQAHKAWMCEVCASRWLEHYIHINVMSTLTKACEDHRSSSASAHLPTKPYPLQQARVPSLWGRQTPPAHVAETGSGPVERRSGLLDGRETSGAHRMGQSYVDQLAIYEIGHGRQAEAPT